MALLAALYVPTVHLHSISIAANSKNSASSPSGLGLHLLPAKSSLLPLSSAHRSLVKDDDDGDRGRHDDDDDGDRGRSPAQHRISRSPSYSPRPHLSPRRSRRLSEEAEGKWRDLEVGRIYYVKWGGMSHCT